MLSVVSPVFQNAQHIYQFAETLSEVCQGLGVEYEIILVNDGSSDSTWEELQKIVTRLPNIAALDLVRNVGQHKAVMAGLSRTQGRWVIILDSDLEEDPNLIPQLLEISVNSGLPSQVLRRKLAKRGWKYRVLRSVFYRIFRKISDISYTPNVSNYGCYPRALIEQILATRTSYPFIPSLINKYSRRVILVEVDQSLKFQSETTYTAGKLLNHSLQIVVNNSKKPLYLVAWVGLFSSLVSVAYSISVAIEFFAKGVAVTGWASLAILISLGFSLTIISIGILAIYVSTLLDLSINSSQEFVADEIGFGTLREQRLE